MVGTLLASECIYNSLSLYLCRLVFISLTGAFVHHIYTLYTKVYNYSTLLYSTLTDD